MAGVSMAALLVAAKPADVETAPAVNPAAPTPPPATNAPSKAILQLQQVIGKLNAKLVQGKRTDAELADELKEYDALITQYEKVKNDDTAQIIWMRGVLYFQVMDDPERAIIYFRKVLTELPDTAIGQQAANVVAGVQKLANARKIQKSLVPGAKFPDFSEKDVERQPLSLSRFKGKVVLVDFWATWCGPCKMELPNVIATYQKYNKDGFEIVGISLDQDERTMKEFAAANGMKWPQYWDGKIWETKLALQYGVMGIPATYLLDGKGNIIARDLRGPELEQAVAAALKK